MPKTPPLLKVKGKDIVDPAENKIYLRGVNLGAWLMMEGYFLHGRNISEHIFKKEFTRIYGSKELDNFERLYRENFITGEDIKRISKWGANCVRVPFNYRIIEGNQGWTYLDKVINWCQRQGIWCILDLHAAPGAQNPDWHSDSSGEALFWWQKKFQKQYLAIWQRIARRYKFETTVAGYDLLNEPVVKNAENLRRLYAETVEEIRKEDRYHIIFLEANDYAQQLVSLGRPKDKNIAYSIHLYQPIAFTFNFQPQLRYPGFMGKKFWDARQIYQMILPYKQLAEKWQIPLYVGEFGLNYRSPRYYGELRFLKDMLKCFQKFGFHWTYWTYKAVAGAVYPDGIYQYLPNSPWVKREGPISGWESFFQLWKTHKAQIVSSWKTEKFVENKYISHLLSSYF